MPGNKRNRAARWLLMFLYYCAALVLLHYHRVSNAFAVLPASARTHISMPTSNIASSSASSWLASGHPKLNRGRMLLRHPALVLLCPLASPRNTASTSGMVLTGCGSASRNLADQNRHATSSEAVAVRAHCAVRSWHAFARSVLAPFERVVG